MLRRLPWPGDSMQLVERESWLYARILAGLDRSEVEQNELANLIVAFRDLDGVLHWGARRDELIAKVGRVLRPKRTGAAQASRNFA